MSVSVLMYHAVLRNPEETAGADPYYAVDAGVFAGHLSMLTRAGYRGESVAALRTRSLEERELKVGLTFDDGHVSNLEVATPALIEHGMTADFFVNPTTVGEPGFISWAGLRDMAEQGMSIQSHGYSHCYFDELPAADIREQLARSKSEIEDHVGVEVTLFAPPGGRLNLQVTAIARELGYAGICSSRPGTWSGNDFHVPRMAILSSTSSARFVKWVTGAPLEMLRSTGRYEITRTLKKTLGNTVYDRVRGYLVGKSG